MYNLLPAMDTAYLHSASYRSTIMKSVLWRLLCSTYTEEHLQNLYALLSVCSFVCCVCVLCLCAMYCVLCLCAVYCVLCLCAVSVCCVCVLCPRGVFLSVAVCWIFWTCCVSTCAVVQRRVIVLSFLQCAFCMRTFLAVA